MNLLQMLSYLVLICALAFVILRFINRNHNKLCPECVKEQKRLKPKPKVPVEPLEKDSDSESSLSENEIEENGKHPVETD